MIVSCDKKVVMISTTRSPQRLQYSGAESVEDTWLRRLLLDPEQPRKQLLEWVLQELSPGTHRYEDSKVSRQSSEALRQPSPIFVSTFTNFCVNLHQPLCQPLSQPSPTFVSTFVSTFTYFCVNLHQPLCQPSPTFVLTFTNLCVNLHQYLCQLSPTFVLVATQPLCQPSPTFLPTLICL